MIEFSTSEVYSDDQYFKDVFEHGTVHDLEELKWALLQKGDWLFACAAQGRIDEIMLNERNGTPRGN